LNDCGGELDCLRRADFGPLPNSGGGGGRVMLKGDDVLNPGVASLRAFRKEFKAELSKVSGTTGQFGRREESASGGGLFAAVPPCSRRDPDSVDAVRRIPGVLTNCTSSLAIRQNMHNLVDVIPEPRSYNLVSHQSI
jgi:hypothetical protein